jgi:hypothetical protein
LTVPTSGITLLCTRQMLLRPNRRLLRVSRTVYAATSL